MRTVDRADTVASAALRPAEGRLQSLNMFLTEDIENGFSARASAESQWRELLRQYDAIPKVPVRSTPVENAPNTEVPLGAIAADSIYAQAVDLMFQVSPPITVRDAGSGDWVDHAKSLQTFMNWGAATEWGLRQAADHTVLDDVQLGTGVYYIPWVEQRRKHRTWRTVTRMPQIYSIALEDFLVPGGAGEDLQRARWVSRIEFLSDEDLSVQATEGKWDVAAVTPANVSWVRARRESLSRTTSSARVGRLYEIHHISCYYDIDADGHDEDLEIVWDRSSHSILDVRFNRYDTWPYEAMRYQLRAHLFYGMGVMEMLTQMQTEITEIHNHRNLNMILANARIWKARRGKVGENLTLWPNRIIELDDPTTDLMESKMSDIYPSAAQAETMTIALAERRTGSNELSTPHPSQMLGNRTPATTAISMLQTANRRFTPAFDGMRLATARAAVQCVWRYRERVLAGDAAVEQHLIRILGEDNAGKVSELLRQEDFTQQVSVELTASSASLNRDADRQNAIALVNLLGTYYEKTLQLAVIASSPQTPPAVRNVATKIMKAGAEVIDRTMRTFDSVRDPSTFTIEMEERVDAAVGSAPQNAVAGLGQLLQGFGGAPPTPLAPAGNRPARRAP